MQHADEDNALHRILEFAARQQINDHRPTAGMLACLELRQDMPFGEFTRGHNGILAAEILDDALFGAAIFTHALDKVEVGVAVDVLLAGEHAKISSER
jgi:hypothetical protein